MDVSGDFYERQARFEAKKAEKMSRLRSQEEEREKFTFKPEISETSRYLVEARRGQRAGLREREIVDDIVVQARLGRTRGKSAELKGSKTDASKSENTGGRRPFQPEIGEFAERIRFDRPVVDRLYSTRGSYVKRASDLQNVESSQNTAKISSAETQRAQCERLAHYRKYYFQDQRAEAEERRERALQFQRETEDSVRQSHNADLLASRQRRQAQAAVERVIMERKEREKAAEEEKRLYKPQINAASREIARRTGRAAVPVELRL